MRRSRTTFTVAVILAASAVVGIAGPHADISGTWHFSVDVGDTHGSPTFVFQQRGHQLTGTVTNGVGTQTVAGSINGDKAVFSFQATREGRTLRASYEGTVASPTTMKGRVEFTGSLSGVGTWVAMKQ